MRHRIVQYRGKRFSLKLDDIVWHSLAEIAAASGMRLNHLVAQIAEGAIGESSITGAIRSFCLRYALERVRSLERELADRSLVGRGVALGIIAEAIPTPCFLVSQDHLIQRANAAAQTWLGIREPGLIGKSLEHYFSIKASLTLPEMVGRFRRGEAMSLPAQILYLRPGRVLTARAQLCPGAIEDSGELIYLLLIEPTRRS